MVTAMATGGCREASGGGCGSAAHTHRTRPGAEGRSTGQVAVGPGEC